jgi:ribosomal protein L11 methyltransferase
VRRIVTRVRSADLPLAYDRLLPLLRGGLHTRDEQGDVLLVALGEDGELPALPTVSAALGELALVAPVEESAGADLAAALAQLVPRWDIGGRNTLRTAAHPPPPEGWIDVVLGGGAGFGVGAHPTTRQCLALLLDVEPRGAFADLGCGAGGLTIAAAKLGFAPVVGIDLLDAVTTTAYENAVANAVDADFLTRNLLGLSQLDVRVAVVNVSEPDVHAHVATVPAPELEVLIVSGLNEPAQLGTALAGYAAAGFTEVRRSEQDGWPAVQLVLSSVAGAAA